MRQRWDKQPSKDARQVEPPVKNAESEDLRKSLDDRRRNTSGPSTKFNPQEVDYVGNKDHAKIGQKVSVISLRNEH